MLKRAYFTPYIPAVIPQIGAEKTHNVTEFCDFFSHIKADIQQYQIDKILIISGQTVPCMDEFLYHSSEELMGDFSLFESDIQFYSHNDLKFIESFEKESADSALAIRSTTETIDFGHMVPLYFLHQSISQISAWHISANSPQHHKEYGRVLGNILRDQKENYAIICSCDMLPITSPEHSRWNQDLIILLQQNLKLLESLDPFQTEDIGGFHIVRALQTFAGIFAKHFYKYEHHVYREAFGIGLGAICWEILDETNMEEL